MELSTFVSDILWAEFIRLEWKRLLILICSFLSSSSSLRISNNDPRDDYCFDADMQFWKMLEECRRKDLWQLLLSTSSDYLRDWCGESSRINVVISADSYSFRGWSSDILVGIALDISINIFLWWLYNGFFFGFSEERLCDSILWILWLYRFVYVLIS
jgi:hypothetical protein